MTKSYVTGDKIVIAHQEGDRLGLRIRSGQTYSIILYDGVRMVRSASGLALSEAQMIVTRFINKEQNYEQE